MTRKLSLPWPRGTKIALVGFRWDRLFTSGLLEGRDGVGWCWFLQFILVPPAPRLGLAPDVLRFLLVSVLLPTAYLVHSSPKNLPETCGFLLQAPLMPWTHRSKRACPIASHSRPFSASGWCVPWGRVLCHSPFCSWCQAEPGFGVNSGCKENGSILPSRPHGVRMAPPTRTLIKMGEIEVLYLGEIHHTRVFRKRDMEN